MGEPFGVPRGLYSTQGTLGNSDVELVREAEFVLHEPRPWAYSPALLPEGYQPSPFPDGCRYELLELPFTMPALLGGARFAWVELAVEVLDVPVRILRMDPGPRDAEVTVSLAWVESVRRREIGTLERRAVVTTWSFGSSARWTFTARPGTPIREGDATAGLLLELPHGARGLRGTVMCRVEVVRAEIDGDEAVRAGLHEVAFFDTPF